MNISRFAASTLLWLCCTAPAWSAKKTDDWVVDVFTTRSSGALEGFVGPVRLAWRTDGLGGSSDGHEFYVHLKQDGRSVYETPEQQVGDTFGASSSVGRQGSYYEIEFLCSNESATCVGDSFRWALVDCGCPSGQIVTTACSVSTTEPFDSESAICGEEPDEEATPDASTAKITGEWSPKGSGSEIEQTITSSFTTTREVTDTVNLGVSFSASGTCCFQFASGSIIL